MKFATRLAALFSGIFLLFAATIIYFTYTSNIRVLETQIAHKLEKEAFHTIDKIDRMLYERFADIKMMASDPVINSKSSTPQQITERLIEFRNRYKVYASLSFFTLDRTRIADTSMTKIGEQHSLTEYWTDIAEGKDLVMNISKSDSLKQVIFYFASIVKDKNGFPFGLVVSKIPVEKLYDITKQAAVIHNVEIGRASCRERV